MKNFWALLLIMVIVFTLNFCTTSNEDSSLAPDFALEDVNGNKVSLSDFKGKVIILDFWATWCRPCRIEIPFFVKLYEKYKDEGLVIIGISLDKEGKDVLIPFIKKYGINYPIVLGNTKVERAYGGIRGIPTTFIIDKQGRIRNKHIGVPKNFEEVFENEFLTLKNED